MLVRMKMTPRLQIARNGYSALFPDVSGLQHEHEEMVLLLADTRGAASPGSRLDNSLRKVEDFTLTHMLKEE